MSPSKLLAKFLALQAPARFGIGAVAGGSAAAAENATLLNDVDPSTKKVNVALGALTGGVAGAAPKLAPAALLSVTPKQLALLGYDSIKQITNKLDPIAQKNLETANVNKETALMALDQRWKNRAQMFSDIGLGTVGVAGTGALAYWLAQQMNKKPKIPKGEGSVLLKGEQAPKRKRVRIDIPANALPPAFFDSLVNVDDAPKADMSLMQAKTAAERLDVLFKRAAQVASRPPAPPVQGGRSPYGRRLSAAPVPIRNPLRDAPGQVGQTQQPTNALQPSPTPPQISR